MNKTSTVFMAAGTINSILGADEVDALDLFDDPNEAQEEPTNKEEQNTEENNTDNDKQSTTEDLSVDDLFDDGSDETDSKDPESVGSGKTEDTQGQEDASSEEDDGTSPNDNNFYSSIANACAEEGIFPDLEDETIKNVKSAEDFRKLIDDQISAGLDERQKRIEAALNSGIQPTAIQSYENTLKFLDSTTEDQIKEESEKGEQLRSKIIYQDFLNKGYSQQKAQKLTERTIDNGTDVEDALEALQSNKEYFQNEYNNLLKQAQKEADKQKEEQKKWTEDLNNSILKDKDLMGDIELDSSIRKRAVDTITKPVFKDPDTGEYMTALQKYQRDHSQDFLKYTGLIFALTNGYKDFDGFTKGKVKKEVKKGLRNLEKVLNTTRRDNSGSLNLVTKPQDDPESILGKGIKLDF